MWRGGTEDAMPKFRKRPGVIEAVQLLWSTWDEVYDHAGVGKLEDGKPEICYLGRDGKPLTVPSRTWQIGLRIPTTEGLMVASERDWIIRGVKGELYACKPDVFELTYEPVEGIAE